VGMSNSKKCVHRLKCEDLIEIHTGVGQMELKNISLKAHLGGVELRLKITRGGHFWPSRRYTTRGKKRRHHTEYSESTTTSANKPSAQPRKKMGTRAKGGGTRDVAVAETELWADEGGTPRGTQNQCFGGRTNPGRKRGPSSGLEEVSVAR